MSVSLTVKLFLTFFILLSCVLFTAAFMQNDSLKGTLAVTTIGEEINEPAVFNSTTTIQQGTMRLIEYPFDGIIKRVTCEDERVRYTYNNNTVTFFISASYDDTEPYTCALNGEHILTVNIEKAIFDEEIHTMVVDNRFINPSEKELLQMTVDRTVLDLVYKQSGTTPFNNDFINPYESREVISHFGEYRMFQNRYITRHGGIDYPTEIGTPLVAVASGTVRLAHDLFFCGGTVIIDHGFDIFSVYCHLEEITAEEGDTIAAGDPIGAAGNTGLSTEPHLHLAIKHRDDWIDPTWFIDYIANIQML